MKRSDGMLEPFEDPDHKWNSDKYWTGKPCITNDCAFPAGTCWSPLWCFECNSKRMKKISSRFNKLDKLFNGGPA